MSNPNMLSGLLEPLKKEVNLAANVVFEKDLEAVADTGWSVNVAGAHYGSLTYHVASAQPVYRPLNDDDFSQLLLGLQEQSDMVLQTVGGLADSTTALTAIVERLEPLVVEAGSD